MQIDYIQKYIGDPIIIDYDKNKQQKEFTFVDSDYYVSIITDINNKVLAYSITTRTKDFNPILKIKNVQVQLGKTTFYYDDGNAYNGKPNNCYSFSGNTSSSYYYEVYYGWNGTAYQDFLLGYNDAGYGDRGIVMATLPTEEDFKNHKNKLTKNKLNCKLPSDKIRKKYVINTFGVGKNELFSFGVDRRQMEIIKKL